MKTDIVVAGVGGQGILTIAFIVDNAALKQGLQFKQSEVHGMSQRGGAVQSFLRLSDSQVHSDLVPLGAADLILAVEPLEALRCLDYLSPGGVVVSSMSPCENIADYPPLGTVLDAICKLRRHVLVDADRLARTAGSGRAENTVMIGAVSPYLPFSEDSYRELIGTLFARKKAGLVDINLRAFELGLVASRTYTDLLQAGVTPAQARLLARMLDFSVDPRPSAPAWVEAFRSPAGPALEQALASLEKPLRSHVEMVKRLAGLPPAVAEVTAALHAE